MEISAKVVKELRDKTNVGFMECKKALKEAKGDIKEAVKILRKKGIAKAYEKSKRDAKDGIIYSYIHPGAKIGVLLELNCETDFVARTDGFIGLAKKISMQIAAANPIAISSDNIDQKIIDDEKEIFREQALNQKKPEKIIDKIVEGRMKKFYKENCLLEQPFIMDENITVQQLISDAVLEFGEKVSIGRFSRYQIGK
ncbi:MAG: translation elongation factor Ts [Candidatus Cloacimonetes bacterium]|nr:translation elongation factor Ts [Candidatus Cloacimonadota bacterium]MBL7085628.1 translation elongation factor Ts [Candidatus Cloacimonadota bacterium]